MPTKERYQGTAECLVNKKKLKIETSMSVDNGKIKEITIKVTPSSAKTTSFCKKIKDHLTKKRVEEASNLTKTFIQDILELKEPDEQIAEVFSDAICSACTIYSKKRSQDSLKEVLNELDKYEEGYPPRTMEDVHLEYGDCNC